MSALVDIHPTIRLDHTVERKNESQQHWAIKAAISDKLHADPSCVGAIETEKKTSDLIGDIRCHLSDSPPDMPQRSVVEIETAASNKDRLRATIDHLRFGYAVYWVFTVDAHEARRETEDLLDEFMTSTPSLGVASLADGELALGTPIVWDEFSPPDPWLGQHELYIPTYNRWGSCFDHGDFAVDGDRVAIYRQPGSGVLYASRYLENGQQTLPRHSPWKKDQFQESIREGEVERVSPVRGPP
ncbi:hypothetical protein [Natronosalvus caseinilyticus]|uniref:hypothetical protein n=1 Tax=Natronosalvus caseinilyticus TaxID=2953747 RepID=UPI0028AF26C0|nr:hypothetical protein [Natronosalvus caseinilyticus]